MAEMVGAAKEGGRTGTGAGIGTLPRVLEADPASLEEIEGAGPQAATPPPRTTAATVGIRFVDHLIIGDSAPFSFKSSGLL